MYSNDFYNDMLGKEFEYDGRGPNTYDCYGVCYEVYKRLGRFLPEFLSARCSEGINQTIDENKDRFQRLDKPEPFCLVTMVILKPYVSHIGVVLEDCKRFIHIHRKRFVCIESLDSDRWKDRIDGFWRYQKN